MSVCTRMSRIVAAACTAVALAAWSLTGLGAAIAQEGPRLEITYELTCPSPKLPDCADELKAAVEARALAFGLDDLQLRAVDSTHLTATFADRPGAAEVLTRPGRLSFHLVDDSPEVWKEISDLPEGVRLETWKGIKGTYHEVTGDVEGSVLQAFDGHLPTNRQVGIAVNPEPTGSEGIFSGIVLHKKPSIPAGAVADARALSSSAEAGMPAVLVDLSAEAAKAFEKVTGAHLGQRMAVVVDGEVIHAPKIREAIKGGKVHLTKCAWRVKLDAADLARAYAAVLAAPLPEGSNPGTPGPSTK